MKKQYFDYLIEIDKMKKNNGLSAMQVLTLQIAASFKVTNTDYDKLKKEFLAQNKENVPNQHRFTHKRKVKNGTKLGEIH